ncbi:MAG: TetR/AcrR family transcriptional regulator [Deltaproteobacteria bacterium]|nr:TetR/AcrR family transcriptional regulator [Deltaproteobacteria bacterium]
MGLEDRRKREKDQRRSAILNAARKLFFEKGFRHVTVENIARKAELSKGSIYIYFRSKEEIYTQILLNDIDKFNKKSSLIFQNGKSAAELVMDFAFIYVDFFLNDRELFRIMMTFMLHTEDMNLAETVNQHIIEVTNNTVKIIETILQQGIEKGEFPSDINLRLSRNAMWGLLNGIISLHLFTGKEANKEERIRSAVKASLDIFINGLRRYKKSDEMINQNINFQTI